MRGFEGHKHDDRSKLAMANTWDKVLDYNQLTSKYYAIMVEKFGKGMADYYWNKRYKFENGNEYINLCKEINEKCDKFLKSRGIEPIRFN